MSDERPLQRGDLIQDAGPLILVTDVAELGGIEVAVIVKLYATGHVSAPQPTSETAVARAGRVDPTDEATINEAVRRVEIASDQAFRHRQDLLDQLTAADDEIVQLTELRKLLNTRWEA